MKLRLGELEQQFGLVKNSAADMKAAGVPGGLKYISGTHSGVPEGTAVEVLIACYSYDGRNCIVTSYFNEILYNSYSKSSKKTVAWSLFFILLLYSSAPMLATLSKLALMDPNLPTELSENQLQKFSKLSGIKDGQKLQVFIADFNGDGVLQLNEWFERWRCGISYSRSSRTTFCNSGLKVRVVWLLPCQLPMVLY